MEIKLKCTFTVNCEISLQQLEDHLIPRLLKPFELIGILYDLHVEYNTGSYWESSRHSFPPTFEVHQVYVVIEGVAPTPQLHYSFLKILEGVAEASCTKDSGVSLDAFEIS